LITIPPPGPSHVMRMSRRLVGRLDVERNRISPASAKRSRSKPGPSPSGARPGEGCRRGRFTNAGPIDRLARSPVHDVDVEHLHPAAPPGRSVGQVGKVSRQQRGSMIARRATASTVSTPDVHFPGPKPGIVSRAATQAPAARFPAILPDTREDACDECAFPLKATKCYCEMLL